jgi:hypothetical protein
MLEEALVALATAGGLAVVQAAGTDAWAGLREQVARLLGRGNKELEQAELVLLDQTAAAVLGPISQGEADSVRVDQQTMWRVRFESLLESLAGDTREQAATELQALLDSLARRGQVRGEVSGNTFTGPTAMQVGDNNRQDIRFGPGA